MSAFSDIESLLYQGAVLRWRYVREVNGPSISTDPFVAEDGINGMLMDEYRKALHRSIDGLSPDRQAEEAIKDLDFVASSLARAMTEGAAA